MSEQTPQPNTDLPRNVECQPLDGKPTAVPPPGPVQLAERIRSLDVLRGFAVLGILVINIQAYSMIMVACSNPTAYGDLTGADYWVWFLSHVLFELKFMAIFSMLFGAGIVLMTQRREQATGKSAAVHYRRMGWLLLFGLAHAYLLWYGDILFTYGVCGMIVYLFRRRRPAILMTVGLVAMAFGSLIVMGIYWSMPLWPAETIESYENHWEASDEYAAKELSAYRGGWTAQMPKRTLMALRQECNMPVVVLWRCGGLMLIGMALFKLDVFSGKRPSGVYLAMIAAGVLIGVPIVLYGVHRSFALEWEMRSCLVAGPQLNYWGSLFVALGWIGLIMLICRHGLFQRLTHWLAATGQMAFTNYIVQTLICTTIFYGHGFGMFGKVERTGQIAIVLAIWMLQLAISPLWLRYFRFGPLEWLWRSLTYRKAQPFKVGRAVPAGQRDVG